MADVLQRITQYYDVAPRTALRAEPFGSLVLFFTEEPLGWRYCARPALDAVAIDPADVRAVRDRQRSLGIPEAFEWIDEAAPWMRAAMVAAGLPIVSHPLMALAPEIVPPAADLPGVDLALVDADDPDLARIGAVGTLVFSPRWHPAGVSDLEALAAACAERNPVTVELERRRLRSGATAQAAARLNGVPVAIGAISPFGDLALIVGVATLPAFRRRGLSRAICALLVRHARGRGVRWVFLSAGGAEAERMYAGLGFQRVGTACYATAP